MKTRSSWKRDNSWGYRIKFVKGFVPNAGLRTTIFHNITRKYLVLWSGHAANHPFFEASKTSNTAIIATSLHTFDSFDKLLSSTFGFNQVAEVNVPFRIRAVRIGRVSNIEVAICMWIACQKLRYIAGIILNSLRKKCNNCR